VLLTVSSLQLENLLLDANKEHVKLIDLGLAAPYFAGPLHTSCGSSDYAAPELFTAVEYAGPPVDVWAAGTVLYSMLTSLFPFDTVQSTLQGELQFPNAPVLTPLVMTLLSEIFVLDPAKRITVDQIRRQPWVHQGYESRPHRAPVSQDPSPNNQGIMEDEIEFRLDVLALMEEVFGFTPEAVVESLFRSDINQFTATYKMLIRAHPDRIETVNVRVAEEALIAVEKRRGRSG
jgi:serine/threonine protein kinase